MATDLRKTGIDVISQMPWGTHFCLFYETKEDLLNVVVPYLKAGLDDNEFCVWVVADPVTEEDAWRALSQAVPAFEHHRSNQSIEVLPARDWYLKGGHLGLERVTSAWNRKLTQALARGYAGMRVSGDTLWLEKKTWKGFLEYENQLDKSITDQLMTILCTYPLTSSSAAEILDVARSHQFTLARRGGAWEVIETPELKQAKAEIKSLNEQLERRVVERTVQLAASNEQLKLELIERQQAETLLHAREQEFRAFVENAPDQIIRYDKEFRRAYVNPAVSAAYGLPKEAFIGKPVGSVVEDAGLKTDIDEVAAIRRQIKSVFDTGQATEFEVTFPSPGGRRTYWTQMYPEFDPNGVVINVLAISREITDRKKAEEDLRRSEEKFKAVFESAPVGIAVLDRERKIVDMNLILEQMMRINKEGLLAGAYRGRTYIRPDGTPRPFSEWASERAIHENRPIYGVETGIVLEDGEIIWVQVNAVPLGLPDASAVVITQDITERKRAEEALRKSERVLREAESLGHTGSWEHDLVTGEIFNTGENLRLFFGDDPSKGAPIEDYSQAVHPEDREFVMRRRAQLLEGGPRDIEYRVVWPDGSVHVLFGRATIVRGELGQPIRIYGTNLDITERKQAEAERGRLFDELSQSHEQLKTLSSRLAEAQETERRAIARELHDEFGQSLTALKMDLAWLNEHLPPRSKGLRAKVDSALDLTNETIQMTHRLASQLRPRMLDDLGLAAALEWHVNEWSKHTRIKTKVNLPEEEWELGPSLNSGLYRVCQEALTNVARHAGASKVEVSLAREGDEVVLTVRDNGRGMDAGKITAPESLGLLGMKERVEQIGGRLEVQSEAGKGTTVVARVPVSQSPSPKEGGQAGKVPKGRGSHRRKKS